MPTKVTVRILALALSAVALLGAITAVSYASKGLAIGGNQKDAQHATTVGTTSGQNQVPPCGWTIKPVSYGIHKSQKDNLYRLQDFCAG
jgi:hypothetical protein